MTRAEVRKFLFVGDGTDLPEARVACASYSRSDVTYRGGLRSNFIFI